MGYSGSMGNSVRVTNNHFYGNANGLTTDTLSAPGHPGFPADGMKIDHNWFYANNLDIYTRRTPRSRRSSRSRSAPASSGPGNNNGRFEDNWVFDNWRQGTMLISIPDAVAGEAEGEVDPQIHCPTRRAPSGVSTSCDNQYSGNHMGQVPPDFKPHPGLTKFGNQTTLDRAARRPRPTASTSGGTRRPPTPATAGSTTPAPTAPAPASPATRRSVPRPTSRSPASCPRTATRASGSPGVRRPRRRCCSPASASGRRGTLDAPGGCTWFNTPPQPGTRRQRDAAGREQRQRAARWRRAPTARRSRSGCSELAGDDLVRPARLRPRAARACAARSLALALLAGCGDGDEPASAAAEAEPAARSGEVDRHLRHRAGRRDDSPARSRSLVECRDWNGADEEERLATIADVRSQINLEDSGIERAGADRRGGRGDLRQLLQAGLGRRASGSTSSTRGRPASSR